MRPEGEDNLRRADPAVHPGALRAAHRVVVVAAAVVRAVPEEGIARGRNTGSGGRPLRAAPQPLVSAAPVDPEAPEGGPQMKSGASLGRLMSPDKGCFVTKVVEADIDHTVAAVVVVVVVAAAVAAEARPDTGPDRRPEEPLRHEMWGAGTRWGSLAGNSDPSDLNMNTLIIN